MKKFLPLILLVLIIGVCLGAWTLSAGERYKDPPAMLLYCGDRQITLTGSAISWSYDRWLGRTSYEASLIHPTERSDWPTDLKIDRAEEIKLAFVREDGPIEKLGEITELRYWNESAWGDGDAAGTEIEVAPDSWEQYAFMPLEGRNLYAATVKYFENEHYSGTVRYVFVVDYPVK